MKLDEHYKKIAMLKQPKLKVPPILSKDIDHILWLMEAINSYDLRGYFEPLHNLIGNLMSDTPKPYMGVRIPNDIKRLDLSLPEHNIGCFRFRKFPSLEKLKNEVFEEKNLWAREKENVKDYGRCHSFNQSVLYCTSVFGAGFYEVDAEVGDYCVVARFVHHRKSPLLNMLLLGESRHLLENDRRVNRKKIDIEKGLNQEEIEKLRLIEEFLTKIFRAKVPNGEEYRYKMCASIAKFYYEETAKLIPMQRGIDIHGIIYPSMKAANGPYNFAIKSEFAQRFLWIKDVIIIQVVEAGETYRGKMVDYVVGLSDNDAFIWASEKNKSF